LTQFLISIQEAVDAAWESARGLCAGADPIRCTLAWRSNVHHATLYRADDQRELAGCNRV
jgi:hypothetical protein